MQSSAFAGLVQNLKYVTGFGAGAAGLLAALLLSAGCSSDAHKLTPAEAYAERFPTETPAFIRGGMGALLTNAAGYSAHVNLETNWFSDRLGIREGELLVRGSRIMFAAQPDKKARKGSRAAGFMFIWDEATGNGYLVSEALQGYAAVGAAARPTEVSFGSRAAGTEKIEGHRCIREEATVKMSDGTSAAYQVWRAPDLGDIALKIVAVGQSTLPTLKLSKVKTNIPMGELFEPPPGFVRYDDPQLLVGEIVARQRHLTLKKVPIEDPNAPSGPVQSAAPR